MHVRSNFNNMSLERAHTLLPQQLNRRPHKYSQSERTDSQTPCRDIDVRTDVTDKLVQFSNNNSVKFEAKSRSP